MRIGIIGAGFAGLVSAKVLGQMGHRVTVYEKAPDIGGVWSSTRRYPGLEIQNNKGSYGLSDLPMPRHYPEAPSGEQVHAYLETYVERFGLARHVRLGTEVSSAVPAAGGGWEVTAAGETEHVDHLVVANGIYSQPDMPEYDGAETFRAVGGRLVAPTEVNDLADVEGRHVVVVGFGKSACDVALGVAGAAASSTVVARRLSWKVPRRIQHVLNYKYFLLSRMGEAFFPYRRPPRGGVGSSSFASWVIDLIGRLSASQLRLRRLGLVPDVRFGEIPRTTISLDTDGFFPAVGDGRVSVVRDATIERLLAKDGRPYAALSTGEAIPADIVVAATGWRQELPFLPADVVEAITDEHGDYLLHRNVHPVGVPDLSFVGYNTSFLSPLSAEIGAIWVASLLAGNHRLPPDEAMRTEAREMVAWNRDRMGGKHARGTSLIPFTMRNIDELLGDVGIDVSATTRARQWLLPINPCDYDHVVPTLAKRVAAPAIPT